MCFKFVHLCTMLVRDHVWIARGSVLRNKLKTIIIIVAKSFKHTWMKRKRAPFEHVASEENLRKTLLRRLNI